MTTSAPERTQALDPVRWRDAKRYVWLLGMVMPLLSFAAWGLAEATGSGLGWWFGPFFVFVLVPLVDLLVGQDPTNPPQDALGWLEEDRYYRWITYAFLPLQYVALIWACQVWATFDLATVDRVGLALTVGCVAGIGINTAHELGHKAEKHERWLARVALAQPFYGHFFVEHNKGHHLRVATPEDPASARVGETVYGFWPRTVWGSLASAWGLEKRRLQRRGRNPWSLANDVLSAWAISALLWGVLVLAFGPGVLPYLMRSLRDFEESPVLPTGYAGMIVLALVPPLWRRVMDPKVAAHFGGDLTRANLHRRVAARLGVPADVS